MQPVLIIHVAFGAIAVLSGITALLSRKGARLHRTAGAIFFASMLTSAAAGVYIALTKPEMITLLAGCFTIYLVATAWITVKRKPKEIGGIELVATLGALAIGVAGLSFGIEAQNSVSGLKDGYSAEPYFFFGALALLAVAADVSVLIRRGVTGRQRIARHLWRMSFALYIATGSAFTGPGAQAFPEQIRGSILLTLPENTIALLMMFWLIRVLLITGITKLDVRAS